MEVATNEIKKINESVLEKGKRVVDNARQRFIDNKPNLPKNKLFSLAFTGLMMLNIACNRLSQVSASVSVTFPTPTNDQSGEAIPSPTSTEVIPAKTPTSNETLSSIVTPNPTELPAYQVSDDQLIARHYSELARSTKPLQIETVNYPIYTALLNYDDNYQIDARKMENVYDVISSFSASDSGFQDQPYTHNGREYVLGAKLRPNLNKRVMVFVKRDQIIHKQGETIHEGATIQMPNVSLSYIRADKHGQIDTTSFTVEACQQTLEFQPWIVLGKESIKDSQGKVVADRLQVGTVEDKNELVNGQELGCNSLGFALAARASNESYEKYKIFVTKSTFSTVTKDDGGFLFLSKKLYDGLPAFGRLSLKQD